MTLLPVFVVVLLSVFFSVTVNVYPGVSTTVVINPHGELLKQNSVFIFLSNRPLLLPYLILTEPLTFSFSFQNYSIRPLTLSPSNWFLQFKVTTRHNSRARHCLQSGTPIKRRIQKWHLYL